MEPPIYSVEPPIVVLQAPCNYDKSSLTLNGYGVGPWHLRSNASGAMAPGRERQGGRVARPGKFGRPVGG